MSDETTAETTRLLELSRRLLDVIDAGDWDGYADFCDPTLTAYEPEAVGQYVVGMDFHRFYFDGERPTSRQRSTISAPNVRLMGDVAVVAYVRLVQRAEADAKPTTIAFEETRVWQRQQGEWRHVHFHRSRAGEWPT